MTPVRAGTSAGVAVLAAAGLLLVLVTWAASIGPDQVVSGGHVQRVHPPARSLSAPVAAQPDPAAAARAEHRGEPPAWLAAIAWVLELLTLAVVAFLARQLLRKLRRWWRTRSRSRRIAPEEVVEFEVLDSAAHVSELLEADAAEQRIQLAMSGAPRNAIVECWHRFEEQAVRAGMARRPWQTTAEFVLGVLDLVGADRGAVSRLADLYREARFSDHPMTDAHRSAALAALDEIHRSLRTRVAV
jgi:hypothetical protein